jgi:hypothetical protein
LRCRLSIFSNSCWAVIHFTGEVCKTHSYERWGRYRLFLPHRGKKTMG